MDDSLHVGIQLTESCNLACRHCCTSSSPAVQTTLSREYVRDLLRQAHAIDPAASVVFTGGEVFYVRELLYDAIETARELGLSYSINTNGSWAADPAERDDVLNSILDVRQLAFGTDDYHGTAVPKSVVGTGLKAALELGIEAIIRYTYAVGEDFEDVLAQLGLDTPEERARVDFSGLMPIGRASRLDAGLFPVFPEQEPCFAASTIMVRSTGGIYGCCGDSLYVPGQHDMRHGHVQTTALADVVAARKTNLVLHALRTVGPRQLAATAGVIGDRPRDEVYARSSCGSCHLLLQERNVAKARAAAAQFTDRVAALRALYYGEV